MGESNALAVKRGTPLRRDTALAAAAAYQHLYCDSMEAGDTTDNIAATYQVCLGRGIRACQPGSAESEGAAICTLCVCCILNLLQNSS